MLGESDTELRMRDHPDVLSVCRWLPQSFPFGAFSGQYDVVHVSGRQALVNLWMSSAPVHEGDYVGPPRGGLVPGRYPDYDVVMPAGGYLRIRAGILQGWDDDHADVDLVRADGDSYIAEAYGPSSPYLIEHYRAMSEDDRLNALATLHRRRVSVDGRAGGELNDDRPSPHRVYESRAIAQWVESSRSPRLCECLVADDGSATRRTVRSRQLPTSLLSYEVIPTVVGTGTAEQASEVVLRLSGLLAEPERKGLVYAAEAEARRCAQSVSGWPEQPITEEAVALVAAQALRWHGLEVAPQLPFWTLGWIFLSGPVLDELLQGDSRSRRKLRRVVLDRADQLRMRRVAHAWAAANRAEQQLDLAARRQPEELIAKTDGVDVKKVDQHLRYVTEHDYQQTVESVIAELAAQ